MKTILILILALGCGSEKKGASKSELKEGWTDIKVSVFKDSCTEEIYSNQGSSRVTIERSRSFCSCLVSYVSEKYNIDDFITFTDQIVKDLKVHGVYKSCADSSGLEWNEIDGVYLFTINE